MNELNKAKLYSDILAFIVSIGVIFLASFVTWKIYGWFSPHVRFELPELSYLNVLFIRILLSGLTLKTDSMKLRAIYEKLDCEFNGWDRIVDNVSTCLSALFVSYLFYIIFI